MQKGIIDYNHIALAVNFYSKLGYQYIEVPWTVSKKTIEVTKPPNARYLSTFMGEVVASGEQSFIEISDKLCRGMKYQCVTPCFRDDKYDELHLPYFMKNELIVVLDKNENIQKELEMVIADVERFIYSQISLGYVSGTSKAGLARKQTDIGFDLEICGIEIGSYGYRKFEDFEWIYGTGCAEPRLTQVLKIQQRIIEQEDEEIMRSVEC